MLNIILRDPWLEPYSQAIEGRHNHALQKENSLTGGTVQLPAFAMGYEWYGLHREQKRWVFREWAPDATAIFLVGDFSNWQEQDRFKLHSIGDNGDWEVSVPLDSLSHGQHYKLSVYWNGGHGYRIPAWCNRVVQDRGTNVFSAQVWNAKPFKFRHSRFSIRKKAPLLIYECHVGMAQEKEDVGTYSEFKDNVLPRIKADGYNCIQIMAIQEHPYYGSFGYHVSSFFAPSSRFGTPEELKELIDTAHGMGLGVIMDLVHSHSARNENEGIGNMAGNPDQYFLPGNRHSHPAWDSLCFDYGKNQVLHFLLSNCRYWLEEFHFDGFRFDGVTSMLYYSHGLGESFCNYDDYFNGRQDDDAICYLMLANKLIHEVNPNAVTIAEEVSGMPGIAAPFDDGGYGFDYRLAMNIPDYWIKTIKEKPDHEWPVSGILWETTNRRSDERTISYVESHDQALVGDKTVIFRLVDADMYWHFSKDGGNDNTARGIALHKMIRLVTASTMNGGYLNFMGNEFGHPEWIDFPREGNGWSCKYARRQWSLIDNRELSYDWLGAFDRDMLELLTSIRSLIKTGVTEYWHNDSDQVLAFGRGDHVFVFNFSPDKSYSDYGILVPEGRYMTVLDSDSVKYGGYGRPDDNVEHVTLTDGLYKKERKGWLMLYLPSRTALVLKQMKI